MLDPGLLLHASLNSAHSTTQSLAEHSQLSPLTHSLQGKKSRAVRYSAAAGLDEDVFLHPNSTLHSTAPEFVVYAELIRTAKRPYMAGGSEACFRVQWDAGGGMPAVGCDAGAFNVFSSAQCPYPASHTHSSACTPSLLAPTCRRDIHRAAVAARCRGPALRLFAAARRAACLLQARRRQGGASGGTALHCWWRGH